MSKIELKIGENPGLSNAEYHSEHTHLSSSNLKMLLKDPAQFYNEKVLGNRPPEVEKPHFLVGSYCHSLVLEPELVEAEYAFFEGWRKQGKDFDAFKAANPGKTILSKPQADVGQRLAKGVFANPNVSKLLTGGAPELSLASKILDVPVKMRADYINKDAGYIVDLKTTSHPTDAEIFKMTVKEYAYDLSAALYCQIAHDTYHKVFDFYLVVVSKSDLGCNVYKMSTETLSKGAADMIKAVVLYKKCKESGVWDLQTANKHGIVSEDIILI